MEYQKKVNLLDNETTQPSKFRTKNWVEVNNDRGGTYYKKNVKFKTTMLKSSFCDYSDAYILVKGTVTVVGERAKAAAISLETTKRERGSF